MFFYLITLNLARFLNETAPHVEPPKEGKISNARAMEAWKHSDFLCHNYVLNGLVDFLYNVYCKTTTAKELSESLERKYKKEDVGYKWIFKKKMKADGTIDKYKARLVIKGFRQREGLDYFDTYSPIMRITSIRMVLAIAAFRNLEVHQMDVKPSFLNGDLEEEKYMNQPEGS
ncbi:retrotransposon protein, putative, ty1-copia subclass [Tanacetum coccineum]